MSELLWYVYQNKQQMGPFGQDQVVQLISNNMIAKDAYLFKVGWKDWLPLEACFGHLGLDRQAAPDQKIPAKRFSSAPRATIQGRVVVHNNGQVTIGKGINISASGIFIETKDKLFAVGEQLKLSVKADGLKKPFNVEAEVIRFNNNPAWPIGYGIRFINLSDEIKKEINQMVQHTPDIGRAGYGK